MLINHIQPPISSWQITSGLLLKWRWSIHMDLPLIQTCDYLIHFDDSFYLAHFSRKGAGMESATRHPGWRVSLPVTFWEGSCLTYPDIFGKCHTEICVCPNCVLIIKERAKREQVQMFMSCMKSIATICGGRSRETLAENSASFKRLRSCFWRNGWGRARVRGH